MMTLSRVDELQIGPVYSFTYRVNIFNSVVSNCVLPRVVYKSKNLDEFLLQKSGVNLYRPLWGSKTSQATLNLFMGQYI